MTWGSKKLSDVKYKFQGYEKVRCRPSYIENEQWTGLGSHTGCNW